MAKRPPLVIDSAGVDVEITSADLLRIPGGASLDAGYQSEGGIMQPKDMFADFVIQGFLTPVVASLTGTMSTAAWPGGTASAVAYAGGHRVYKLTGDSTLTFTYTASKDTYDDIDLSGTITHSAVNNGAGAPAQAANTLRLQKVVTNGTQITSVTQLASTSPTLTVAPTINVGNLLYVDAVNGSDSTGTRGRFEKPFLTVAAALAASSSGDVVIVRPGTYTITSGLTMPTGVALRGVSLANCKIQMAATADATLLTMGESSRVEAN